MTGSRRINYEITGPHFTDDHIQVKDTVMVTGKGKIEKGLLIPDKTYTAAYCSGSTITIKLYPTYREDSPLPELFYSYSGNLLYKETVLHSFTAEDKAIISNNTYEPISIELYTLPENSAKQYTLTLNHTYTIENTEYTKTTEHIITSTWKCPIVGYPIYEKVINWGAQWLDGTFEDNGETTENLIADKLLTSMKQLEELGFSYGGFSRPPSESDNPDEKLYTNKADVFLDFKRSACGEFQGFFQNLLGTQGISSNWLWFYFSDPKSDWYSMYETIDLPALGTSSQVWRYQDHVVVEVNDIVYDPTYLLIKENADAYEDYIFQYFCYGEDRRCVHSSDWCTIDNGPQGVCIENPPGYDSAIGPNRFRGYSY